MNPFIAEILMFGGNFAPRGWAFCDGQLMAISSNTALFSLIGTTYGGDGRSTFALPDLRGRLPIHAGTGPGLTTRKLGARGGVEEYNMNVLTMASHFHYADLTNLTATFDLEINSGTGISPNSKDNYLAATSSNENLYSDEETQGQFLAGVGAVVGGTVNIGNTGNSQSINNMAPSSCINYIIALQGVYPSRS